MLHEYDPFTAIKMILIKLWGVDESQVTLTARFREDLEADSYDLSGLFPTLEDEFGVEISDEEAQKITTVGEAVMFIASHT